MPTKEEKHQSSSGNGAGGNGTTNSNSTNTTNGNSTSSSSSSSSAEKHLRYCMLCNRNDFTLNTFNVTIEKDLRAIFNTEIKFKENRKVCLQCLHSIKLLKRPTKDGHIKQKSGDCCKDLFDNMTYFQELRNKYQRYVNRLIDNRKDSSKKSSSSSSAAASTALSSESSSSLQHSPASSINSPASLTTTSPDVTNTTPSQQQPTASSLSTNNNSNSSNSSSTSNKHLTKLNDKSSSSSSKSSGKCAKPIQTVELNHQVKAVVGAVNAAPQSIATTITNPPIVVKTKERERERERDKDKEKEKDLPIAPVAPTVKSNGTTTIPLPPTPVTIKNKAQLKLLPKHIDNNATTNAAATVTINAAEVVKQKSATKPENCNKEKLIHATSPSGKSQRDAGGDTTKSNNIRRSSDRRLAEKEQMKQTLETNSTEKTKLLNGTVPIDNSENNKAKQPKIVVPTPHSTPPLPAPAPPPPPLPTVEPEKPPPPPPLPCAAVEKKDDMERISRAKLAKLPTNTKRTRTIQRSNSPVRPAVVATQTPTRQQRNCTFEQAICQTQNASTKQKVDEHTAPIINEKQTSTTASSTVKVAEKKGSAKATGVLAPTVEKFEYTIINGMRIEVPQRAKLDKKMFTCFVRMNDKPNLKRKANGQLADVLPEPTTKKRKNAASKKTKVEIKQVAEQSSEPIEKAAPEPAVELVQAASEPEIPLAPTIATNTPAQTNTTNSKAEPEADSKITCQNQLETPKSILQKSSENRFKTPLEQKKRVSFTGIPVSPPLSPNAETESMSQSLPDKLTQSTDLNDVKIVSNTKKSSEKAKKVTTIRPPTPPIPASAKTVAPVAREKKEKTVVTTPKVTDTTKKVVEAIKPIVEPEKMAVTPTTAVRLRPKKSSKTTSSATEQKPLANDTESSPSNAKKVINNVKAIVPATIPPPSPTVCQTVVVNKAVQEKISSKSVPPQSKLAVSIDNNNAISARPDDEHNESSAILSSIEDEPQTVSETDNGLDSSTQKSIKTKRKSYTKRAKSAKSKLNQPIKDADNIVTPKVAVTQPKQTRGRPTKRKNLQTVEQLPDPEDSIDAIETNSVEIVNLEEIKRNKVLLNETIEEYAVVNRSTCVMLDDKDEDDVKMVMEDDPLAIGVCTSPMSSPTRMPLPMPMLIHRTPEITSISSSSKQQQQSPKKMAQLPAPIKLPSPTMKSSILERPESTQKSPEKMKATINPIRLKISHGKVTEISPSKCMTPTNTASPKAGARNRTKRIRKRKQHKDFVSTASESDDESPSSLGNDNKKCKPNEIGSQEASVNENCHVNTAAEVSIVSSALHSPVEQISVQLSPTIDTAAAQAAAAAAMDTSPIASPQYSPVSKTPSEPITIETQTPPTTTITTTTTTAPQQFLQAVPTAQTQTQYDERVFRAYVLVDKIPQVNSSMNTVASIASATCNASAPGTHVINTQPLSVSIQIPTSVSMSSPHGNLSNHEAMTDAIEQNFSHHMQQLQTIQHNDDGNNSNSACDPHSIESFVESCQEMLMETIESDAHSMNVIQNYTTLNDGTLNDGVYELQDGTLCENIESPMVTDNAGTIIGFESPATVDSTTSGYSSATTTSSVYLLTDTQTVNHSIEMSNGFNADGFNLQFLNQPFYEIQTSDIIDILGKSGDCGESVSLENISLDSTVPTAIQATNADDTRTTYYLTDGQAIPINAINTVHATVMPTITTGNIGNILGVFRTKAALKQMNDSVHPMQLNVINTDVSHHIIQQQAAQQQQQQQAAQQQQQHQIINMHTTHGHHTLHQQQIQHHNNHGIPNELSAKMLRTDCNLTLNAVISSNDESAMEMHDTRFSMATSVDSMVTSSADSDNATGDNGTPPLPGSEVNNCNGSNSNDSVGNGNGGINGTHRRPGLNVVFSTPSKRCNNVYLSNENVSIDDFISESNQSLLNPTTTLLPDNFPTTTTTEEPHLDFFTLEI